MTNALTIVARKAQPAADDLLHIVRINEPIKRVVGVSSKINIRAPNAIFLTKRAVVRDPAKPAYICAIYRGADVQRLINWFDELPVGIVGA